MKNFKFFFTTMLLIISSTIVNFAQGIQIQANVGTNATFLENGMAKLGPSIGASVGYTFMASDATRINVTAFSQIRQQISQPINGTKQTHSDIPVGLKTGFEVGEKIRMGLNFGAQVVPGAKNSATNNYKQLAGLTEGTLSFNQKNGMSIGGSIIAEKPFKSNQNFPEQTFGKYNGTWTGNLFFRKTFGKRKGPSVQSPMPIVIPKDFGNGNSLFGPAHYIVTDSIESYIKPATIGKASRDFILRDSLFGIAMNNFVDGKINAAINGQNAVLADSFRNLRDNARASNIHVFYFGENEATIGADTLSLTTKIQSLDKNTNFTISSFTSNDGKDNLNRKLCSDRATTVIAFLRTHGFTRFKVLTFPQAGNSVAYRKVQIVWRN